MVVLVVAVGVGEVGCGGWFDVEGFVEVVLLGDFNEERRGDEFALDSEF